MGLHSCLVSSSLLYLYPIDYISPLAHVNMDHALPLCMIFLAFLAIPTITHNATQLNSGCHSTIAQSHNTMLGMLSGGKKMIYSDILHIAIYLPQITYFFFSYFKPLSTKHCFVFPYSFFL